MATASKPQESANSTFAVVCVALNFIALALFTPIGGYVNLFLSGTSFIAFFVFAWLFAKGVVRIDRYHDRKHWREISSNFAACIICIFISLVCHFVLPAAPLGSSGSGIECTRSGCS